MKTINAIGDQCTNIKIQISLSPRPSPRGLEHPERRTVQNMGRVSVKKLAEMRQRSLIRCSWGSSGPLEPLHYCHCQGMWTLLLLFPVMSPRPTHPLPNKDAPSDLLAQHFSGLVSSTVGSLLWKTTCSHPSLSVVLAVRGVRLAVITERWVILRVDFSGPDARLLGFKSPWCPLCTYISLGKLLREWGAPRLINRPLSLIWLDILLHMVHWW